MRIYLRSFSARNVCKYLSTRNYFLFVFLFFSIFIFLLRNEDSKIRTRQILLLIFQIKQVAAAAYNYTLSIFSKHGHTVFFYASPYLQELMANAKQYGEGDKLALYGLFKQAKWGDCPAGLVSAQRDDPVGSVKVRAWVTNRGKPTSQAMQEFIAVLCRVRQSVICFILFF